MANKPRCPECGFEVDEFVAINHTSVIAMPCLHTYNITHSLKEVAMSAARSNPEVFTTTPADGPMTGLILPDRVLRKSEFPAVAADIVERMLEVTDSPSAFILLRQVQEVAKAAEDILKPKVMLAAAGAAVEIDGAKIEYRKTPAKWDYRNDPERDQLLADIDTLKQLVSAREKFLQAMTEPMKDKEGREILPAVAQESSYTLAVTFPKEGK